MKKNFLFFTFILLFLQNCGFAPIYTESKNEDFKFNIIEISGDIDMNNLVNINIKKYSNKISTNTINLKIDTNYKKNIISKNKAGEATSYLIVTRLTFQVIDLEEPNIFTFKDETKLSNINNKFELRNYENSIKNNFISSAIEKLILKIPKNK